MAPSVAPVLVAGGGPSGLVAALTLLQNHVPVRIIDKEPHYRIAQRSNGLWPRTFEAFHFLRVHEVYQRAGPVIPIREYKPGTLEPTKTFLMITPSDPTPSIPYSDLRFLGQPPLESILRSHLEAYGCFVELGTELESFEDVGERVLAKLVKRKDGSEIPETFEASYLIGADGAKGVTRKQLGLKLLGDTNQDLVFVVGDLCFEAEGLDRNVRMHWHMFRDTTADFITLRPTSEIAADGFHCMINLKDYEPKQLIADPEVMVQRMSELIGRKINVRKVVALSEFRPNTRMVDMFGRGRVFLAGDAAHVHSPAGGQGLNASVQDALNLAWKLALVYKGLSPTTLLDSYTMERLPVIAEMLNITTGMMDKMVKEPKIEKAMVRERRLNLLGVNYRMGPIVLDEFTTPKPVSAYRDLDERELVAGDRAPDATALVVFADGVETESRLFDVFGVTHHTVLVFAPDALTTAGVLEALKGYPSDIIRSVIILPKGSKGTIASEEDVVVDEAGHAYRAYLAVSGEQKAVVVRPDGVAGAIVHGAEGVRAYFDKVFVHR